MVEKRRKTGTAGLPKPYSDVQELVFLLYGVHPMIQSWI